MNESHLYEGFRYASALSSIGAQRDIQKRLLRELQPREILVIGCAHGDELSHIVSDIDIGNSEISVAAIDLSDVREPLYSHEFARLLGSRLQWRQLDLMKAAELPAYGRFDVVQCGFVLHDIPWELKDRAMGVLLDALRPGGHLLISEIVAKPDCDYRSEIGGIYDVFVDEANEALNSGLLDQDGWRQLVGNEAGPGLLQSKAKALQEGRDYFDTLDTLIGRAEDAGLRTQGVIWNDINDRLAVAVLKREGSIAQACMTKDQVNVH
jgi:SAM-dependent methyltransferase